MEGVKEKERAGKIKVLTMKPDNLSSNPKIYMLEGDTYF